MSSEQLRNAVAGNKNVTAEPKNFPAMIEKLKKQVAVALPKHLNAERMSRIALTEFNKNKQLANCDPITVFASVIIAAQLGLEPGIQGQGYLIPYKGKCQFVPGWKGLVDLAQRSGRATVWTGAVYEGDFFEYSFGSNPKIEHKPSDDIEQGQLTHVYAVGWVRGAEYPVIDVWSMSKIWKHRDKHNKVGTDHYSYKNQEMYARKVPLLQVLKYMPSSIELQAALDMEYAGEGGAQDNTLKDAIEGNFTTITPEEPQPEQPPTGGVQTPGPSNAGPPAPIEEAVRQLREAGSLKDLKEAYAAIGASYIAAGKPLPLDIEAVYTELKEVRK